MFAKDLKDAHALFRPCLRPQSFHLYLRSVTDHAVDVLTYITAIDLDTECKNKYG